MAERFGGKYSPGADGRPDPGARRTRVGLRVNLLFLVPFLLLFPAFGQPPVGLALDIAAFGLLMGAAWLTREGLLAQEAYDRRKIAKRPAIPRKIFASVLTGAGLATAALSPAGDLLAPVIFAVLGFVLHLLSFGPDPLTDKGVDGAAGFETDRVARAVDDAERRLSEMRDAIARAGVPPLTRRVERFARTVSQMLRAIEEDPRDLAGARRFVGVYLEGAREATVRFADLYQRRRDDDARDAYVALLDDLEGSFAQKTEKMLADDRVNLDVEIDVLRERLAREGIAPRLPNTDP